MLLGIERLLLAWTFAGIGLTMIVALGEGTLVLAWCQRALGQLASLARTSGLSTIAGDERGGTGSIA